MKNPKDFQQIVCPYSENNPRNSEGDLIQLPDGRLLLAWSNFVGGFDDHADGYIAAKISADGGYTWSEPFVLQPNTGKCNVMSVSFLPSGNDVLFFYLQKDGVDHDLNCFMKRSSDCCKTWSDPVRVSIVDGYNVVNNGRVIRARNNRILVPAAYYENYLNNKCTVGICYYSDDDGVTWQRSKQSVVLEDSNTGLQEPGLVELKDGSLMMIIRSDKGYIYKSKSSDCGDTWSTPEPMPLVSCVSPATVKRIPDTDKLLMIWNPSVFGKYASWRDRWPLCSAISEDEGETWSQVKYLEMSPDKCHAYTSITFIGQKVYLTYYEWNKLAHNKNFEGTSLKLRIIDRDWFFE